MPEENNGDAPIIPAGTQRNLYGSTMAFAPTGEQTPAPTAQTREGETTPTAQTDAPKGTTFAELAAKKGFRDADALAAAYANLETSHTAKSMELSELVKVRQEGARATPQAQERAQQALEDKGYTPDEAITIVKKLIQEEVAPVKEQLAIRETFRNPDDMQHAPAVAELVRKNPTIPWDAALKLVKYDILAAKASEGEALKKSHTDNLRTQTQAGSPNNRMSREVNLDSIVRDKNIPFKEVQKMVREHFSQ